MMIFDFRRMIDNSSFGVQNRRKYGCNELNILNITLKIPRKVE